jgi:hypothetical protein
VASDILKYLPWIMQEIEEFKQIANAENPEIDSLFTAIGDAMNDQFVNDSTVNGVKRWESILNIVPKGTDTLDVRKFRILSRLNEKLPYTYRTLENNLISLCGENGFTLELNNGTYTLIVRVELVVKGKFDEVNSLLKRTVPANMVIDLSLRYNQHGTLSQFTNGQLKAYTHGQLRNEVIT